MSQPIAHTMLPRIGDGNMNKLIDLIERALNRLESLPFANVKFVTVTFPAPATGVRVFHGLGYPMSGFFKTNTTADTNVWTSNTPDAQDPNNFVLLASTLATTLTLAVF